MSIAETVAEYVADGARPVYVLPSGAPLRSSVPGSQVWEEWGGPGSNALLVTLWPGQAHDGASELAAQLGPGDVAIAVLPQVPADLPVGWLVTTLTEAGLRVLAAKGIRARWGRTLLVLATDPSIPVRGYLLDTPMPDGGRGLARFVNEWSVERLQTRAHVERLESQLDGARAEAAAMQAERDRFQLEAAEAAKALATVRAANTTLRAESRRTLSARARRAARMVRDEPVKGSVNVARAAVRRARG